MPKINPLLHAECGCRLDGEIYLYVGKAVMLRNRLMAYSSERRISIMPPWVRHFTFPPHEHILCAAVWYIDRPMISAAECTLIDTLKPLINQKDRLGFAGAWEFRKPDQVALMEELTPNLKRSETEVWVEERPGVYAWFMEPGSEFASMMCMAAQIPDSIGLKKDPAKIKDLIIQGTEISKAREKLKARRGFELSRHGVAKDLPFA